MTIDRKWRHADADVAHARSGTANVNSTTRSARRDGWSTLQMLDQLLPLIHAVAAMMVPVVYRWNWGRNTNRFVIMRHLENLLKFESLVDRGWNNCACAPRICHLTSHFLRQVRMRSLPEVTCSTSGRASLLWLERPRVIRAFVRGHFSLQNKFSHWTLMGRNGRPSVKWEGRALWPMLVPLQCNAALRQIIRNCWSTNLEFFAGFCLTTSNVPSGDYSSTFVRLRSRLVTPCFLGAVYKFTLLLLLLLLLLLYYGRERWQNNMNPECVTHTHIHHPPPSLLNKITGCYLVIINEDLIGWQCRVAAGPSDNDAIWRPGMRLLVYRYTLSCCLDLV